MTDSPITPYISQAVARELLEALEIMVSVFSRGLPLPQQPYALYRARAAIAAAERDLAQ